MSKTLVILTLEKSDDFLKGRFFLQKLLGFLQKQGFVVQIVSGVQKKVAADIAIAHIDLTIMPKEYQDYLNDYPIAINGKACNISKSLISENLVSENDQYGGPVIVKTDANFGGVPELVHQKNIGLIDKAVRFERPWRKVDSLDTACYPRFDSIKNVPSGVWKNKRLIVEKFLPEINKEGQYCLRHWYFFGDKEVTIFSSSENPIIKTPLISPRIIGEVPEKVRTLRQKLNVDFGRFDYVIVDGEPVIYDVNTTPAIGDVSEELLAGKLSELAKGIEFYT